ncbi:Ig-like domain-containing protein [Bifidobacterium colobi]|nr:Ig-like domain-containing protein [Bifidobacterium colobi]
MTESQVYGGMQWQGSSGYEYDASDYLDDFNAYASQLKTITGVTNPADVTVESGTAKPTDQLTTEVAVTYDDNTTGTAKVTWKIPDDWNADLKAHTIKLTGTVEGTTKTVTLNLNVKAAKATAATFKGTTNTETSVTTEAGTAPNLPKTATVTWSNGSTSDETINWGSSQDYKKPGTYYDLKGTVEGFTLTAHVTVNKATITKVDQPEATTVSKGATPTIPTTVKVHWSYGDPTDETITWDANADPKKASFNTVGSQTFTGTAAGQKVTWKVTVVETKVTKAYDPVPMTTEAGVDPTSELPSKVQADLDNGQEKQSVSVVWDTLPETWKSYKGGTIKLKGTVNGQADQTVTLTITVKHATIQDQTLAGISVPAGVDPTSKLPETVTITWSHNTGTQDNVKVAWNKIDASAYQQAGSFTATGTVTEDGQTGKVSVPVTVTYPVAVSAEATSKSVDTIATNEPVLSGVNATVQYTNGTTTTNKVKWESIAAAKYAEDQAGKSFEVTGTVLKEAATTKSVKARAAADELTDANDNALTVKVTVNVTARKITAVTPSTDKISVDTAKNTDPTPTPTGKVTVTWNDKKTGDRTVNLTLPKDWNKGIDEHTVTATGTVDGWTDPVPFTVTVNAAKAESVAPIKAIATTAKIVPTLPEAATVTWSNGETTEESVTWTKPADTAYDTVGQDVTVKGTVAGLDTQVTVHVVAATITSVDNPAGPFTTSAGKAPTTLPSTVNAHWSNKTESSVAVVWDTKSVDFSNRSGKDKTVTVEGTVQGWNQKVEAKVTVASAKVTAATVDGDTTVKTDSGTAPKLPENAKLTWDDGGAQTTAKINWAKFDGYKNRDGDTFTVHGDVDGWANGVDVTVEVAPATPIKVEQDKFPVSVEVGGKLTLPAQVNVIWSNNDKVPTTVAWDTYDAKLLTKAGTFTVNGTVTPKQGTEYQVTATVTVTAKKQDNTTKPGQNTTENAKNNLSNTGSSVAIIAVVALLLVAVAVTVLAIAKRQHD